MQTVARTILIIDDSQDDVLITKRVLSKIEEDIEIEVAFSGESGLEFLRNSKSLPSLILLDLKMPGMGGLEVLNRIRLDDRLKDIAVVVVTHSALESDVTASYRAGANSVLQKSFSIDQFNRDIRRVLERWLKK